MFDRAHSIYASAFGKVKSISDVGFFQHQRKLALILQITNGLGIIDFPNNINDINSRHLEAAASLSQ